MELFTNKEIDINTLPKVEDLELTPISPKYIYIIVANILFTYGILCLAIVFINVIAEDKSFSNTFWYILAVLITLCIFTLIINYLGFKKRKYAMRDYDITFSKGFLVNKTLTLPYNRIQHIEIKRTFLARKLGLATLKIYTAGESGGDMTVSGLPKDIADKQYGFLTKMINERV
ncbi:PH domain-containing protein [Winogradskyella sp.]|uniref:PH domain-containing protein n=1 Tax=Winogradskyella sp. TaxID=1883156 RepID=UPI00262FA021|nr:PH domain-containing protein [Winogradskyella sp.]